MTLRIVEGGHDGDRDGPPEPGILDGVRVVDTTTGIAGPYATMFLADHGADVVKVEPPGGDPFRADLAFETLNRGKRSAVLDLTTERGRARAALLAATADVVVVDEPQHRAAALGIDHATLASGHPELVYLAVPPYGERGPFVDRPSSPALLAAVSGLMASQMSYSGDPVHVVLPLAAYGTGALAAAAVAGALYARERRGRGQFVEVSQLAGSLALQVGAVRSDRVPDPPARAPSPFGSKGRLPAYRLFRAGDERWFFLACGSAQFFHRMLIAIGHAELAADPRLEQAPWGLFTPEAHAALIPVLEPLFRTRPRDHWLALFHEADVPAQPVQTRDEYFASHVVAANEMRQAVDHPALGRVEMMGVPLVTTAAPGTIRGPAPAPGEHTDVVLAEAAIGPAPIVSLSARAADETPAPAAPMLDGLRVLDLSSFIAGPVLPRHLAMLGADVTKVESPAGDAFRQMGLGFLGWNQGKRDIALDLRRPEARAVLHRMAAASDVVVQNFRPGVAERLGVDEPTLRALNPRLVYLESPGWGDDETLRAAPGFDPLVQAVSGAMTAQGGADEPVFHTVPLNDVMTPAIGTFGVLAALFHRERTGEGQLVKTALARTGLAIQAGEFTRLPPRAAHTSIPDERRAERASVPDERRPSTTSHSPAGTPTGAGMFPVGGRDFPGPTAGRRWYRCGDDGDVYVEAASPDERHALVGAAGAAVDADALAAPLGSAACATATAALASAFRTRARDEWIATLDAAGVPCAPIFGRTELFDAAHVRANELLIDQDDPAWGRTTNTGMLICASGTPGRILRPAPALSEHAAEILDELGYTAEEQQALAAAGAVSAPPRPSASPQPSSTERGREV